MNRYLIISICLIISSCGSYPKKQNLEGVEIDKQKIYNAYFSNPGEDYVYKTNINVYDNSFGGLLIIKKTNDLEHRIVFTTEMGNKIFDFSFNDELFNVNFIIEDLDKPLLINILKKDFQVLIKESLEITKAFISGNDSVYQTEIKNKSYYYYVREGIHKIAMVKNGKEKVNFLFSEINNSIAKRIDIIHNNIRLTIKLKSIK